MEDQILFSHLYFFREKMSQKSKEETFNYLKQLSDKKGQKVTLKDLQCAQKSEKESLQNFEDVEESIQIQVDPGLAEYDKVEEEVIIRLDDEDINNPDEPGVEEEDIPDDLLKQVILQIK